MAEASLDRLSSELFDEVVRSLDLDTIRNLRLVSREIAHKATQRTFRSFLRTKHMILDRGHVEQLLEITSPGGLGLMVENLTIIGIAYDFEPLETVVRHGGMYVDNSEAGYEHLSDGQRCLRPCTTKEIRQAEKDLNVLKDQKADGHTFRRSGDASSLLCDAFTKIASNRQRGLRQLILEVAITRAGTIGRILPVEADLCPQESELILQTASDTTSLVLGALRESRIAVEALNFFNTNPASLCCALPCDILEWIALGDALFADTKRLSVSFSDDWAVTGKQDQKNPQAEVGNARGFTGISALLKASPYLEELQMSVYGKMARIHMTNLQRMKRHRQMKGIFAIPLPMLRKLHLGGVHVPAEDLAAFIAGFKGTLRALKLHYTMLDEGHFDTILTTLSGMSLDDLHLEDIGEHDYFIRFEGPKELPFSKIEGDYDGRNILIRWDKGTTREIQYNVLRAWSFDGSSKKHARWRENLKNEFGT